MEEYGVTFADAYRKLTRIAMHCRDENGTNMPALVILDKCQRIIRLTAELVGEDVDAVSEARES